MTATGEALWVHENLPYRQVLLHLKCGALWKAEGVADSDL